MSTMWDEIRYKVLRSGSRLNLLIGINVAVFLVLGLINLVELLSTTRSELHDSIFSFLQLPAYLPLLATRFWTPITYMFMHDGIINILFNMLWFYWMGQIFEEYLGGKKLLTVYFLGGLSGAALYLLAYNTSPLFASTKFIALAVGAPACVMAVIVATATLLPDYSIYLMFLGEVKLKWLVIVYVLFDMIMITISGANSEREFAHLGGALIGFIYIRQLRNGNDWGAKLARIFAPKPKLKVASKNTDRAVTRKPRQEDIDRILDKISQSGYDSLNKQEKETLFRASNDDKG